MFADPLTLKLKMNSTIFETIQYPHRLCMFLTIVDYPKDVRQVFHISAWLFLIACGYFTNGVFMYIVLQCGTLRRSVMNRLLTVLSLIDVFILTNELIYIVYPFTVPDLPWKVAFQRPLVVGPVWFYSFCEHLSEGVLIVIAYERFRAICYPFHNLRKGPFLVKSLGLVVVFSVVFTLVYAYLFYFGGSEVLGIFLLFFLVGPSVIPFLISTVLYSLVILTIYKSAKETVSTNSEASKRGKKNRRQVVVVLFVNTFVYFAFNGLRKYFDTRLAQAFSANNETNPGHSQYDFIEGAWHWASYMAFCMILNSTINPIIYNFGSNQYRQALMRSIRCLDPLPSGQSTIRTGHHPRVYTVSMSLQETGGTSPNKHDDREE